LSISFLLLYIAAYDELVVDGGRGLGLGLGLRFDSDLSGASTRIGAATSLQCGLGLGEATPMLLELDASYRAWPGQTPG